MSAGKLKKMAPTVTRTMGYRVGGAGDGVQIAGPVDSAILLVLRCPLSAWAWSRSSSASTTSCSGVRELENWGSTIMFDAWAPFLEIQRRPTHASRAFDKDRDGFVIAAGGGVVIVEELEHAKARCEDLCRASRLLRYLRRVRHGRASGEGGKAMREAIAMANRLGGEKKVDYINTHGTPCRRRGRAGAIKDSFTEEFDYILNIGSTKSLSGHALSVAVCTRPFIRY